MDNATLLHNMTPDDVRAMVADEVTKAVAQLRSDATSTDEVMGSEAAAKYLGRAIQWLYRNPDVPHYKRAGKKYYKRSQLDAYLMGEDAGKVDVSSEATRRILNSRKTG
jgi:hypothetical protein